MTDEQHRNLAKLAKAYFAASEDHDEVVAASRAKLAAAETALTEAMRAAGVAHLAVGDMHLHCDGDCLERAEDPILIIP